MKNALSCFPYQSNALFLPNWPKYTTKSTGPSQKPGYVRLGVGEISLG